MCGRFILNSPLVELQRAFEFSETPNMMARYNIAPTQRVAMVRRRHPGREMTILLRQDETGTGRELVTARWGLVPSWAKEIRTAGLLINARAETVSTKPAFRSAFKARRCVIPSDGFYEWQQQPKGPKQPFLIRRRDGQPFGFAGLWEVWRDPATGEEVTSCTIITCEPNEVMAPLHNRMPVILDPADYDRWLDPARPDAEDLLRPCPDEWLELVPVSARVNNVRNDDPDLTQPVQAT